MHLRGASPPRHRALTAHGRRGRAALLAALPLACLALTGCTRASSHGDVSIELTLDPGSPVVGAPAAARVAVRDPQGGLVRGATLRVEAHMSHPGMMPVLAVATEQPDGTHRAPLQFTMAGDWVVHVTGTLRDGRTVDRWIDVGAVRAAE